MSKFGFEPGLTTGLQHKALLPLPPLSVTEIRCSVSLQITRHPAIVLLFLCRPLRYFSWRPLGSEDEEKARLVGHQFLTERLRPPVLEVAVSHCTAAEIPETHLRWGAQVLETQKLTSATYWWISFNPPFEEKTD